MQRKTPFVKGEYYHIYNRGIDKAAIVRSDKDRDRFKLLLYTANSENIFRLDNLINQQHKTNDEIMSIDRGQCLVSIGGWALMTNHFHLLLKEEVEGGITSFMKKFSTAYSMYYNIKYERSGSLLHRPFRSKHIDEDNYMRHLFGYVHLNPLDIKFSNWEENVKHKPKEMKNFLDTYKYSSFQDYAGVERIENRILNKPAFPEYFSTEQDFLKFIDNYLQAS